MAQQPIGGDDLNLNNIQGDILLKFPKKTEVFLFFQIDSSQIKNFRVNLKNVIPFITTSASALAKRNEVREHKSRGDSSLIPAVLSNISFSHQGLQKICDSVGISPKFGDVIFDNGMFTDLTALGDSKTGNDAWTRSFLENDIDGVILVAGDNINGIVNRLFMIKDGLQMGKPNGGCRELFMLDGHTRPGAQSGHEHFGFMDGISIPAVKGVDTPLPGQTTIDTGRVLIGHTNDNQPFVTTPMTRPDWAKDGSVMCFRKLDQKVPEFNAFLARNATATESADLLGACMVGRWKSGAPIQLAPNGDDTGLANDARRNNDFVFGGNQTRCPFAAHIRKTNPRDDPTPDHNTPSHMLMRRAIQFGPEVTAHEKQSQTSDPDHARGLLFVCYQSNLSNGFHFVQQTWVNNPKFHESNTGFDPLIGQAPGQKLVATGFDRTNPTKQFGPWGQFVVSRGGEYFFSPSISTLRDVFGMSPSSAPVQPHASNGY